MTGVSSSPESALVTDAAPASPAINRKLLQVCWASSNKNWNETYTIFNYIPLHFILSFLYSDLTTVGTPVEQVIYRESV